MSVFIIQRLIEIIVLLFIAFSPPILMSPSIPTDVLLLFMLMGALFLIVCAWAYARSWSMGGYGVFTD
jgi:hypothetical protein